MPHEACGEVLGNPCALTLGDEPLAGGVEHGAVQLWMTPAQVGIPLHNLVHAEVREQPARRWQSGIQQSAQAPHAGAPPAQRPWTSASAPYWA